MKKTLTAMGFVLASSVASAGVEEKKIISAVHVNKDGSTFINVNNAVDSAPANCYLGLLTLKNATVNPNSIALQEWYSGSLAALRAGSPVTIDFTNTAGLCVVDAMHFY